jgi:hypothetical protein
MAHQFFCESLAASKRLAMAPMKTHVIVEQALETLIDDYDANKDPINCANAS